MKMRAKKTWTGSFRVDIDNKTNKKKTRRNIPEKNGCTFSFLF